MPDEFANSLIRKFTNAFPFRRYFYPADKTQKAGEISPSGSLMIDRLKTL